MSDSWDRTYPNSGVEIGKYVCVNLEADGEVGIAGSNEHIIGVCQRETPADVSPVAVRCGGFTKVIANATGIEPGDKLKVSAATGYVNQIGGETTGTLVQVIGIAETASSAQGDIIEMLIAPHVSVAP